MKKVEDAVWEVQEELRGVVRELENIAEDIKTTQKNIGEDTCSKVLYNRAEKYRKLIKDLDRIEVRERGKILTWL